MTQFKLTIKKVFIVIISILFTFSIVNAKDSTAQIKEASNEVSVQSPDGSIYFKIFTSNGILNYSVTLLRNPAVDVIKSIPAVWDETIVLNDSEVGEPAVFARRSGNIWYLAVRCGPFFKTKFT